MAQITTVGIDRAKKVFTLHGVGVPCQHSTGGKSRLGRITRKGDVYLGALLFQGARSVLHSAEGRGDPISRWSLSSQDRRGY